MYGSASAFSAVWWPVETNYLTICINKCVYKAWCVRVCFLPDPLGFYSVSVFYLLVRKNLFTFRIPVRSERWPVLMYPLSSPNCPLDLSTLPPLLLQATSSIFCICVTDLHFIVLTRFPFLALVISAGNKMLRCDCGFWCLKWKGCSSALRLIFYGPKQQDHNYGSCIGVQFKQWE